uniref:Uncharacterized protein n=1 Tax=Trichogramma kaykai TaxID=54128 RepID=A0ABD2XAZ4_9HYME
MTKESQNVVISSRATASFIYKTTTTTTTTTLALYKVYVCIRQHECTQWTPRLSLGFTVRVQGQGYAIVRLRTTSTTSSIGSGSGSSFRRERDAREHIYILCRHPFVLLQQQSYTKMTTTNNTSHTPEGLQAEVRSAIRVLHGWCPRPPQQQQQHQQQQQQQQQQQIQPPPPPPPLPQQQQPQHQGPINRGETVLMPPQRPPRPAGSVVVSSTSNGSNGSIVVSSNGVVNGIGGPGAVGSPDAANLIVTNGTGSSNANNTVTNGGSIISGVTVNGGSSSSSSSSSSGTNGASSAANVSNNNNNSNNSMRPPPPPPPRNRNSGEGKAHHEEPTSSIPDLVIMRPIRVIRDPPVVSYSRAMFSTLDTEKEKKKRDASLGFVRECAYVCIVFRHAAHDVYKAHSTHKPWAILPFIIIHAYYKSSAHNKSMARHT